MTRETFTKDELELILNLGAYYEHIRHINGIGTPEKVKELLRKVHYEIISKETK